MSYNRILIAVDSSEYSMTAAKKGFELAHQLDAQAALLFVIDTTKALGNVDAGITHEEALIVLKKEAEETLDQLAKIYNGKEVFRFMPEGHPREEIMKMAEIWEADLLIVPTRGRTGLMHFLLGSNAEYIVRHSRIPVMVVPSK